jgi:hypothetical protein
VVDADDAGVAHRDAGIGSLVDADCVRQEAMSSGRECLRVDGYAWNGATCNLVSCGCVGKDCAQIQTTAAECAAAHAHCDPASTCSRPWYKCKDMCPSALTLRGGGLRGMDCNRGSNCNFDLTLSPAIVLDAGDCVGLGGTLTVDDGNGETHALDFALTDATWEEVARISRSLSGLTFEPSCADCVATPAAWISVLNAQGDQVKIWYPEGEPPAGLRAADDLTHALFFQAGLCHGGRLDSCHLRNPANGVQPVQCGGDPVSAYHCVCERSGATLDAMSCDGQCGSCTDAAGACGAHCVDLCAGDGYRWQAYCTP